MPLCGARNIYTLRCKSWKFSAIFLRQSAVWIWRTRGHCSSAMVRFAGVAQRTQNHTYIVFTTYGKGLRRQWPFHCSVAALSGGMPVPGCHKEPAWNGSLPRLFFSFAIRRILLQHVFLASAAARHALCCSRFVGNFLNICSRAQCRFPLIFLVSCKQGVSGS